MEFRKLDTDLIQQICNLVRMGAQYDVAAVALGCSQEDPIKWVEEGVREKSGLCFDLYHSVRQAQATCEVFHLQKLVAEGGAQASRWILQKTNPEKWGQEKQPGKLKAITNG